MDQLPAEILLHIICYLEDKDVVVMTCVSKRLNEIGRDKELWRSICYDRAFAERAHLWLAQPHTAPNSIQNQAAVALSFTEAAPLNGDHEDNETPAERSNTTERVRAMANRDPSYPGERIDWYTEYIGRYGPLSLSWTESPLAEDRSKLEVRGLGLLCQGRRKRVIAPLDNGAFCVWDVSTADPNQQRGAIVACSRSGLLSARATSSNGSTRAALASTGIVQSLRIDRFREKAYVAVQSSLFEVDLDTMQISSHERFPFSISAISTADDNLPTTVGTTLSLHLHDHRQANNHRTAESSTARTDVVANFPMSPRRQDDFARLLSGDDAVEYAPLSQPGPLNIHHLKPHSPLGSAEIYVAGRFPSVLVYDRRTFPRLRTSLHSGARLCSLTSLPFSFRSLDSDLMRRQQLSICAAQDAKNIPGDRLVAVGEYNGKGSLEIYGLSDDRSLHDLTQAAGSGQTSTFKNRVSASRSKLLSVATHGTKLLVSDSDGNLRWFERDGSSLVRSWNMNGLGLEERRSMFSVSYAPLSSDVARKIVPLYQPGSDNKVEDDEILVWTGERIGVLGFTPKPRFGGDNGDDWFAESTEELLKHREERIYGETMRRALERQADEVRVMQGLGIGVDGAA